MRQYVIRPGDSLYMVASLFQTTVNTLIAMNQQINPSSLSIGQIINIPDNAATLVPSLYTFGPGDTLSSVASRYSIPVSFILSVNPQITNPAQNVTGQRIVLPPSPQRHTYATYIMIQGDTLNSIATRFGLSQDSILKLNPQIIDLNTSYPGQTVLIYLPPLSNFPASRCIIYFSVEAGRIVLWRSGANGLNPIRLPITQDIASTPATPKLSPTARNIAFLTRNPTNLYVVDSCGKGTRMIAGNVSGFAWSKDGTRLAYSNSDGVFVADLQGGITQVIGPEAGAITQMEWFTDGTRIAGGQSYTPQVANPSPHNFLVIIDVKNNFLRRYRVPIIPADNLRVSPNGRYVAATGAAVEGSPPRITDNSAPYVFDIAAEKLTRLPARNSSNLAWFPDSSRVIFSAVPTNSWITLDPSGQGYLFLTANPNGIITSGSMSAGYRKLSVDWSPYTDWIIYRAEDQPSYIPAAYKTLSTYAGNINSGQQYKLANTWSHDTWANQVCPACT